MEGECLAQTFRIQVPAEPLGIPRQSPLSEQWVGQYHGVNTRQAVGGIPGPQEGLINVCYCFYYLSEMEEANLCDIRVLETMAIPKLSPPPACCRLNSTVSCPS